MTTATTTMVSTVVLGGLGPRGILAAIVEIDAVEESM